MATQAQIKRRVKECIALAKEKYGFSIKYSDIAITFKSKGQAAASAWWKPTALGRQYGLKFSTESANLNSDEMLNDTVPHEVAHLVCYWDPTLGKNHDAGWKRVCIGLGGTGARTHCQVLTKARYKTQYLYRTPRGVEFKFGPKRHKTVTRGGSYIARSTNEKIDSSCFVRVISSEEHRREHMKTVHAHRQAQGAPSTAPTSHKRPAPKKRASQKRATGGTSKKARANAIYLGEGGNKAACITRFKSELDMSDAGATTYFYNCRKELS